MIPSERIKQITDILYQQKTVSVKELCSILYCSPSTIRRDLIDLEEAGVLRRTRGGATLISKNITEFSSYIRSLENSKEKQKIASMTTDMIHDDMSIFLDSSSTVHFICDYLYKYKNLIIITNSILVPYKLMNHDDLRVFCTGGVLKRHTHSLVGDMSYAFVKNYKPDICFFSCKAIYPTGIFEADYQQTNVKKNMLANAGKSVLLVDHSKFEDSAFIAIDDFSNVDTIITDKKPNNFKDFSMEQREKFLWPEKNE